MHTTIIKVLIIIIILEFELSLEWFERVLSLDPYRYESLDTYSNILYIKENQGELANLAL